MCAANRLVAVGEVWVLLQRFWRSRKSLLLKMLSPPQTVSLVKNFRIRWPSESLVPARIAFRLQYRRANHSDLLVLHRQLYADSRPAFL